MEGREITNLLLAVIAGVLLFAKDAMLGGLQGFFLVAVAIAPIWGLLALAGWGIRETLKALREAKDWSEVAGVLFVLALCFIGMPMFVYAGWLWLHGIEHPMNEAVDSWIGKVWMGVTVLLFGGFALVGLGRGFGWLSANRGDVPGIVSDRLRVLMWGYLEFLGGPVTFPVRELRIRREAGTGIAVKVASLAYVTVVGLIVSVMTALLTVGAVAGLLSAVGLI
ncbi:hypothetical protein [Mesorhizobium sp. M0040]|uniref:hypothetical protein n=1 Tax=Mesorhizobium sp. M0040 TaxID=2956855 RepID=UPI00333D6331